MAKPFPRVTSTCSDRFRVASGICSAPLGGFLLAVARMAGPAKRNQKGLPLHAALRFAPGPLLASLALRASLRASLRLLLRYAPFRFIAIPGARREGPSLTHRGSRGIHAAQPPSTTIPLTLLKGRLVSPYSSCIGIRLAVGKLRFPTSLAIGSTGRISGSCETRHQLPYLCRSGSSCHREVQEALGLIAFQEILAS